MHNQEESNDAVALLQQLMPYRHSVEKKLLQLIFWNVT